MRQKTRLIAVVAILALVAGCVHLAPGADPIVVRTEQTLKSADITFSVAMDWYVRNKPTLSEAAQRPFIALRDGYDPAYKDIQKTLDAYKQGRATGSSINTALLRSLFVAADEIMHQVGGPEVALKD